MTERITNGLRTWTNDHFGIGDWRYESIMEFADRIDAALEKRYVELPVDADGEPIHIGDELRDEWHEQNQGEVEWLMLDHHGWWLMFKNNCERFYLHEFHEWHHHHAPTVEDMLRDYACRILMAGCIDEEDELVDEYAAKLQLRGDE